jgi:hypothetical protein
MPKKTNFFKKVFLYITFYRYLYIIFIDKVKKMSQNSINQGFSYYICFMIERSGSGAGSGSGSIPLTNGSGWPKNTWIRWIRIRNTVHKYTEPIFRDGIPYWQGERNLVYSSRRPNCRSQAIDLSLSALIS